MSDDITNRFLRAVDSGWRTAEEAAEELGIHPTLISQFRAGIRVPDEPLTRLAETYAEAHNPPAHVLGEADPGDDLAQLDPLIESLQVMASKGDHKERLGPQSALILAKMRRRGRTARDVAKESVWLSSAVKMATDGGPKDGSAADAMRMALAAAIASERARMEEEQGRPILEGEVLDGGDP